MQTTIQKRRIEDDDRKEAILGLIADKYCRSFRLFKEMSRRNYRLTGTVLDLD